MRTAESITIAKLDGKWFPLTCCGQVFVDARTFMDHRLAPEHD